MKIRIHFEVSEYTTRAGDSKTISTYWSVYMFSLCYMVYFGSVKPTVYSFLSAPDPYRRIISTAGVRSLYLLVQVFKRVSGPPS